jgi:hypothetical protein
MNAAVHEWWGEAQSGKRQAFGVVIDADTDTDFDTDMDQGGWSGVRGGRLFMCGLFTRLKRGRSWFEGYPHERSRT